MDVKFKQKYGSWAVVTGATDGIGRAIAIELAQKGLNLIIVARNKVKLFDLSKQLEKDYQVEVKGLALDLSLAESVDKLLEGTKDLDVGLLVAAAGFGTSGALIKADLANELNMVDVNCKSVLAMSYHFGRLFADKKRGGIILFGSLLGFQGAPQTANYAATKAYVQTLAEGLHYELKPFGVDVLATAPGPVGTGFAARANMQMGATATPQEVAKSTLAALGHNVTVRPGFLAKFLGYSLSTMNRWGRIKVIQMIMGGMTKHQS